MHKTRHRLLTAAIAFALAALAMAACGSGDDYTGGGRKQPVGSFGLAADASAIDSGSALDGSVGDAQDEFSSFFDSGGGG